MSQEHIRNFVIISHIDHGKSTLADRFLEITKTVEPRKMQPQYLDRMDIEREKGITIKMQPCRMIWKKYILNLIDTPGHVDFSYEVSRSLAAVEGAILLVDATKGIQAQTIANLEMAKKEKLVIIPAINKIDTASLEQVREVKKELADLLKIEEANINLISAKNGENIEELLETVVAKVPSPRGERNKPLRGLIFDSEYNLYKGIVVYLKIADGEIKQGDKIYLMSSKVKAEVKELGYFKPELNPAEKLEAGEIGYIATGLKDIEKCRVGDTITKLPTQGWSTLGERIKSLKGYKEAQPMVFASFYPVELDDYDELEDGLGKLKLNDASLVFGRESSPALGRGFRCGFLGMLHLEIISERLKRDYGLELVITSPSVVYKSCAHREKAQKEQVEEPWVELEIISPINYLGPITKLLKTVRGVYKDTKYLGKNKLIVKSEVPLSEIIEGFYDTLKSTTSGYASMSYKFIDYRKGDLVKLDILLAGEKINAFSRIISREKVYRKGRKMVELLKEIIPPQQFIVPIQAVVEGKVIARETKKALRKDVIAGLYGGDYTRKSKLLSKQKKGKKKLAKFGKINLPSEVFLKILKQI